jgi:hypothetical protein
VTASPIPSVTLATRVTLLRILGLPLFIVLVLYYLLALQQGQAAPFYRWWALGLFAAAIRPAVSPGFTVTVFPPDPDSAPFSGAAARSAGGLLRFGGGAAATGGGNGAVREAGGSRVGATVLAGAAATCGDPAARGAGARVRGGSKSSV